MIHAVEFMQNVQLACFAVIFTSMALGNRRNRVLQFIWYSFLVDGTAGLLDLISPHLPNWLVYGIDYTSFSLSYGLMSFAFAIFIGRELWTKWITVALVLGSLPFYLLWCNDPTHVRSIAVQDFVLFLQTAVTAWLLTRSRERATMTPRLTMSVFLLIYAGVELYRVAVVVLLRTNPDEIHPTMQLVTSAVYIVSASVLPLAVIWMSNARLQHDLTMQSLVDPLTEVLNRRGLDDAVHRELARYVRSHQNFTVAIADIDHFKQLNDAHGHACGDDVLRKAARLFRNVLRQSDIVSRSGGEEFVLLLPVTSEDESTLVLERLRVAFESCVFLTREDAPVHATISIGITNTHGRANLSWAELHHEADTALYAAKRGGRNRTMRFREAHPHDAGTAHAARDTSDLDPLPTA